ncbi:hypothetical protein D9M72_619940 [compost metagenome]
MARHGAAHVQHDLAAARAHQLQAPLGHLHAELAQLVGQQALRLREHPCFLVGDMVHHVAHQIGHGRVVAGVVRFHLAQLPDEPPHLLVFSQRLGNDVVLRTARTAG